jgi:hypothetical protein
MSTHRPPALLDRALRLLLDARDRNTISGDLLEIYSDEKLPELGPLRANLWYARQLLSILPHCMLSTLGGPLMRTLKSLWTATSIFLALACSWFAVMELILKHPGFTIRAGVCMLIVLYAAVCIGLTLAYKRIPSAPIRYGLSLFALGTLALGVYALIFEFRTTDFEGYIFLIALGLIAQGALTIFNIRQRPSLHPA